MALTSTASTRMGLRALKVLHAPALSCAWILPPQTNLYACNHAREEGSMWVETDPAAGLVNMHA